MNIKDFLFVFIISYDTFIGAAIGIISYILLPEVIPTSTLKDTYSMAINILAILFSMFFAALAIIVSVNDNEFIAFLEEDNLVSDLIKYFKTSLKIIFFMLLATILIYIYVVVHNDVLFWGQLKYQYAIFLGFFSYAITAVFLSSNDAIRFFSERLKYAKKIHEKK